MEFEISCFVIQLAVCYKTIVFPVDNAHFLFDVCWLGFVFSHTLLLFLLYLRALYVLAVLCPSEGTRLENLSKQPVFSGNS